MTTSLPVLAIPAYQPHRNLLTLVRELRASDYPQIYVVNDGSTTPEAREVFAELATLERVKVLHHAVNMGKGQALKTAFNQILLDHPTGMGVVTVDADGQHLPKDVLNVAQALGAKPKALNMGVRLFRGQVPLRSRFGNTLTRKVFHFLLGQDLRDTQTGLRGIPTSLLGSLLKLSSRGYEFELDMLITASQAGVAIEQIEIETIYENNNASSHFNPLLDSFRIYFVFVRFFASSLAAFLVDNFLFVSLHMMIGKVLPALVASRVISATFNFFMVKQLVFKSKGNVWVEAVQYVALVVISLAMSYFLITFLSAYLYVPIYVAKLIAEAAIFLFNFAAQRTFIFVRTPGEKTANYR